MMKRILSLLLTLTTILILTACAPTTNESSFFAMDTMMSLKVQGDEKLCQKLEARAGELDLLLSATDEDSEIARLNREHTAVLSDDTLRLLERTLSLSAEMPDYLDPTIYPAVLEWGFIDEDYRVPDDEWLSYLTTLIDSSRVRINGSTAAMPAGMMLTLGATAKGYLADQCEQILSESAAPYAILNLGGTILLHGKKPDNSRFKVGIADPDDPAAYFGYLTCDRGVVATSGGYERYFEENGRRYFHILDPKTAKPVDNGTLSVTVFSGDGTLADALSTSLFVMGLDKATEYYRSHPDFDFILLTDDDKLYITEGIYDDFTLCDGYAFSVRKITK